MGHLFISYSHKDTEYAHKLAENLTEAGFSVWIDERLDYGSQWPHEIQKQLDTCDAFLLVMTPRAFASDWVQSELQRAKRKLKPIFPLLLEGDEPWLSVESTQYYDVRGERFPDAKFYAALKRVMTPSPDDSTLTYKKVESRNAKPSAWKLWAGGGLLAICFVVSALALIIPNLPIALSTPAETREININLPITETAGTSPAPLLDPPVEMTIVPSDTPITPTPITPSFTPVTPTLTLIPTLIPTRQTSTPMPNIPLYGWWSLQRGDNLVSTAWSDTGSIQSPDYRFVRVEGYVYSPNEPQPSGTVPLYSWYSPSREDNLVSTAWSDTGGIQLPDYRFVRVEGYVYSPNGPQPPGTVPLYSWYSPSREDNLVSTAWGDTGSTQFPDYGFVRVEGYIRQP